jgi:hypothetical protein
MDGKGLNIFGIFFLPLHDFGGQDLSNKKTRALLDAQVLRSFFRESAYFFFEKQDILLVPTVILLFTAICTLLKKSAPFA